MRQLTVKPMTVPSTVSIVLRDQRRCLRVDARGDADIDDGLVIVDQVDGDRDRNVEDDRRPDVEDDTVS